MKKQFSAKKSAFSLIELAIVLIIIGLLIAGVTGGAALIKSAELRAVVTEARSNSISASAFFSLYDSLPGDSSTYTAATAVGDGNGRIEFCATAGCTTGSTAFTGSEGAAIAWSQLKTAGVVNIPGFVGVASSGGSQSVSTTPSMLPSKTKNSGWVFDYNAAWSNTNFSVIVPTGILSTVLGGTDLESSTAYTIFLPIDVFAIDTKNDDGKPGTGKIKAAGSTTAGTGCISAAISSANASTVTYNTTQTTSAKVCTVMFDLDVGN